MPDRLEAVDPGAVRALYDLLGEDREALAELVDSFADEAPARLADLRRGAAEGDAPLATRAAHTLKSNASTFGAGQLASLCRRLEAAARADELTGSAELIDRVDAELAVVQRELAALRDEGVP